MVEEKALGFQKNIIIRGRIHCKTGLHIGGAKEKLEIGGTDAPVVIDPKTRKPVIPGSSLKGKMRALLELRDKSYSGDGSPHAHGEECRDPECKICTVFGSSEDIKRGPARLIIRDAIMDEMPEMEIKAENVINRLTGKSEVGPRFLERVPAGSEFGLEMVYSVYNEKDLGYLRMVFEAMHSLEDNYLGGSGSRGYGKVEFKDIQLSVKTKEDYINGVEKGVALTLKINGEEKDRFEISELLQHFDNINGRLKGQS
jgi:CRISPR-associated protein Csm3